VPVDKFYARQIIGVNISISRTVTDELFEQ
jgi:hypothetical protein